MKKRIKQYLVGQWRESMARSIWDDLTPLGRATIWLPLWLLIWLILPVLLASTAIALPVFWLLDRLPKPPPIFFRD